MVAWSSLCSDKEDDDVVFKYLTRKRQKEFAAAVQHVLSTSIPEKDPSARGPQGPKRRDTSPFKWADHVNRLKPKEFKLRYRLDHRSFKKLCHTLKSDLAVTDEKQAKMDAGVTSFLLK